MNYPQRAVFRVAKNSPFKVLKYIKRTTKGVNFAFWVTFFWLEATQKTSLKTQNLLKPPKIAIFPTSDTTPSRLVSYPNKRFLPTMPKSDRL
jgi:hypothetical protein